jgi:hypothetical protein
LPTGFTSADQTITPGALLTLAHGLGSTPVLFQARLKNVTNQAGWVTGDEVITHIGSEDSSSVGRGCSVYADSTNIYVRYSDATLVFSVHNKGTGNTTTIVNASWSFVIKAWK